MTTISERLRDFLGRQHIQYETIRHRRDYTALETAAHTHTPGREFAKTVFVEIDGKDAMAVVPAHHKIDLPRLREQLHAETVALTEEDRLATLCPDCELGAAPPLGNLYGLPVYMSRTLEEDENITFNAGSHQDAIRMSLKDYEALTHPRVMDFSS